MWQDLEMCLLVSFDIPVYLPQGWQWDPAYQKTLDPNVYNPTKLDTDQWLEAAKATGAGYCILTATHMGGFRQWQSENYPYGLRQTKWRDGKGDVVRDFVNSCHKYKIKPGLFISCRFNAYWQDYQTQVNFGKSPIRRSRRRTSRAARRWLRSWSRDTATWPSSGLTAEC
jgi:alpha-L-fucosidase